MSGKTKDSQVTNGDEAGRRSIVKDARGGRKKKKEPERERGQNYQKAVMHSGFEKVKEVVEKRG